MTMTQRLTGPPGESRKYRRRATPRQIEEIRALFRKVHERGLEAPDMVTCEPHGSDERKLNNLLEVVIEPNLVETAYDYPGFEIVVAAFDKSRQNPINKLFGRDVGDKALDCYWEIAGKSAMLVSAINGSENIGLTMIRVNGSSDEGIAIIGGTKLTHETEVEFREAWLMMSGMADLKGYRAEMRYPDGRPVDVSLEACSKVLRYPEIITAATYLVSKPIPVDGDTKLGFVQEEIARLESREVGFYECMSRKMKVDGELPEVKSSFRDTLEKMEIREMDRGSYIEIKLAMQEQDAAALLPFTKDGWGAGQGMEDSTGTRKGFAEIFSGVAGMRFLNTFYGKARANRILTPIVRAMEDLMRESRVQVETGVERNAVVIPVSGGYLQYWLEMPASGGTYDTIRKAILRRIKSGIQGDEGYANLEGFEPRILMMNAKGRKVEDLRARFILNSMGMRDAPAARLESMDFILNFLENVSPAVQREIFQALAKRENGGAPLDKGDLTRMEMVSRVCDERMGGRRMIRDTEDFIWTLREDAALPPDIRSRRRELEDWFVDFSEERSYRIRPLLIRKVEEMMRAG
ncbi:MAG: hypothetical protein AB1324_06560 [Candidatus Micrarchaeota archaeon]